MAIKAFGAIGHLLKITDGSIVSYPGSFCNGFCEYMAWKSLVLPGITIKFGNIPQNWIVTAEMGKNRLQTGGGTGII
jgi:hypothetical protein